MVDKASVEIAAGKRFAFGDNWAHFLDLVDDDRIKSAEDSLASYLGRSRLDALTFLDIGSGSGLFSLAARNLGAVVTSIDFDRQSVACTEELRRRYRPADQDWTIAQGSILDDEFVAGLGQFEVVYSWGVLHHTGNMDHALANAEALAADRATLFISIYNDQGAQSRLWARVKKAYCSSGPAKQHLILRASRLYLKALAFPVASAEASYRMLARLPRPAKDNGRRARGMDAERDLIDWVGGYPFEVATPETVFERFHRDGWSLDRLKTCGGGLGCNEYVFVRGGRSSREQTVASDGTPIA